MDIPVDLQSQRKLGPDWAAWLDRLPRLCAELLAQWGLRIDGDPMHGFASIVLPVRTDDKSAAVLKVGFDGDDESELEGLALQQWGGRGAVRMFRSDPRRRALLLERLRGVDLTSVPDVAACEITAGLYSRLHRPATPQFRPLTGYLTRWLDALALDARNVPVPRRMIDQAVQLGRAFADDPDSTGTLIHGDLHYENVLAAQREPWVVIDPNPMSGDPHYEVAPLLWNRWDEIADDARAGVARRFFTVVDAANLDEDRARDWVIVRMVLNAHWAVEDAARTHRRLDADEHDWITRCITVAKAVQP
ncbi:aminoglycoside resistance protein [Gordonia sp. TBRC 11910]|uniref:Aminoglycoside resistance protein n=1 Tax=Gordonia asplenii TaxID=2725283 RepID=A0A848KWB5_9ACTN|nr:aminoglycoside phosphotransferase family protein [Gordonia asplenii]NMO03134.1 aminoglycoside resistance protein [Gordonia asplenii]